MDIAVVAREFPLAVVSRVIPGLEDVEGLVDGELRLTGPPANMRTNGELSLTGGALALPELGVRYTDVEAVLGFTEDARATLSASLRSGGPARVNGSLHLRPLRDPTLDLAIDGTSFRAANRYDIEGVVSGQLRLTGNYRSPVVQGALDVEQGTLYLDEFARYQTIVDLADTTFFAAVDTTLAGVLPIIEAGQNPFLDNLVADIELSVESDSWLRSRQIDMEIDGDLELEYDRGARRFVAVGELAAIRGSYNYFGRRFVVQQGTPRVHRHSRRKPEPGHPGGRPPACRRQPAQRDRQRGGHPGGSFGVADQRRAPRPSRNRNWSVTWCSAGPRHCWAPASRHCWAGRSSPMVCRSAWAGWRTSSRRPSRRRSVSWTISPFPTSGPRSASAPIPACWGPSPPHR